MLVWSLPSIAPFAVRDNSTCRLIYTIPEGARSTGEEITTEKPRKYLPRARGRHDRAIRRAREIYAAAIARVKRATPANRLASLPSWL